MRKDGKISEDIIHLFYEMNLQKCEEYFGGELIGSDENRELDKGIICFMIERMEESIPCDQVISRNTNAVWLKDELFECLDAQVESQWNKFLFHILNSFELFTCQEHKEKGHKFANRAVINIYFNNKRKLSTDSVMKDKVKTFKKDKERKHSSKKTQGNFISEM